MSDPLVWVFSIVLLGVVPLACIWLSRRVSRQSSDEAGGSAAAARLARAQRQDYKGRGWGGGPI